MISFLLNLYENELSCFNNWGANLPKPKQIAAEISIPVFPTSHKITAIVITVVNNADPTKYLIKPNKYVNDKLGVTENSEEDNYKELIRNTKLAEARK